MHLEETVIHNALYYIHYSCYDVELFSVLLKDQQ